MGLSAECTVQLAEGYIEYTQTSQSSLLARSQKRVNALAGTLQRTGVPLLAATGGLLVASLFLEACQLLVLQRVGHLMLLVTSISAFHGLVIFSALVLACGPSTLSRSLG